MSTGKTSSNCCRWAGGCSPDAIRESDGLRQIVDPPRSRLGHWKRRAAGPAKVHTQGWGAILARSPTIPRVRDVLIACGLVLWLDAGARGQASAHPKEDRDNGPAAGAEIAAAQTQFYSGRYEAAAATALVGIRADSRNLAAHELRSTALLFRVKSLIPPETADKARAFRACAACPGLVAAFDTATRAGIEAARDALRVDPASTEAQFFLGKLSLNHVWLYLGTLGRRTGWSEYWEGRRAIEAVLARDPRHLRAHVAHAWIDYIVATRMAPGTRWILGGGNKKRAIAAMQEAVARGDHSFAGVEARFALWDLHVREKNLDDALRSARMLVEDFPDNSDLLAFLDKHERRPRP